MTAIIGVKGQIVVPEGPCGINAQVHFTFVPTEVAAPTGSRPRDETMKDLPSDSKPAPAPAGRVKGVFDANGYISKISLAQEMSWPLPGNDGRLKGNMRRELLLERRIPAQAGGDGDLLEVPNPTPIPSVSNSWLVYDDPQGRFHLLYPQELHVGEAYPEGGIDLVERRPDGQDAIQVSLNAKTEDPQRDRLASDPIQAKKQLEDQWKERGEKVVPGPSGWLPEADWSPLKRKVYRIEAALIPESDRSTASGRIYLDHYIVQFTRNEVLVVAAMTTRDPHVQFRDSSRIDHQVLRFRPFGELASLCTHSRASNCAYSRADDSAHSRASNSAPTVDCPAISGHLDFSELLTIESRKTCSALSARIGLERRPESRRRASRRPTARSARMNIGLARNGRNCGGAHDESGRATILARFVVLRCTGLDCTGGSRPGSGRKSCSGTRSGRGFCSGSRSECAGPDARAGTRGLRRAGGS